jgi:hypothetical protein
LRPGLDTDHCALPGDGRSRWHTAACVSATARVSPGRTARGTGLGRAGRRGKPMAGSTSLAMNISVSLLSAMFVTAFGRRPSREGRRCAVSRAAWALRPGRPLKRMRSDCPGCQHPGHLSHPSQLKAGAVIIGKSAALRATVGGVQDANCLRLRARQREPPYQHGAVRTRWDVTGSCRCVTQKESPYGDKVGCPPGPWQHRP